MKIFAASHTANDGYSRNNRYSGIKSTDRFSTIAVVACNEILELKMKNEFPFYFSEDHEKLSQVFNEALFQATAMSNVKLLERLVKAGLPLSVVDSPTTANTALHWAASFGSSEV